MWNDDGKPRRGGLIGATDAFVRRYTESGTAGFLDQFGTTAFDNCEDVAATSTSVFLVGETAGALDGETNEGADLYLRRIATANGALDYTHLVGGPGATREVMFC